MANIETLKRTLRQKATAIGTPLSDEQYCAGFELFVQGSGWVIYQDFIIPQLSKLLMPLFSSQAHVSVLEIGPGPKSVLGHLPGSLRRKIKRYTAFEPNIVFATAMDEWLCSNPEGEPPFPCLDRCPKLHRVPFSLKGHMEGNAADGPHEIDEKYDVILFCHSMYGLNPKAKFIERALEMLVEQAEEAMVAVFHRDGLAFGRLVCHRTASFPTAEIGVPNNDDALDKFASFVAGFGLQDTEQDEATKIDWRETCRALGRRSEAQPSHLFFSAPDRMVAFTRHSTALPELTAEVPAVETVQVKNWEARLCHPASVVRPTEIRQVQSCVQWALKHKTGLTVIGGSHSGHCLGPSIVAVDMTAFDKVHICQSKNEEAGLALVRTSLVVAEAGCKAGDIVRKSIEAGVTVPLGARPSTGAGLWLQGGIGHLARLYGLTCDAIVGVVAVSVKTSQVLCIGDVPNEHCPIGAVRPENQMDLLWAARGAGTNIGIIISVTFRAFAAPTYLVRDWVVPLRDDQDAQLQLASFDESLACKLPANCSADAYLYWEDGGTHLGVTLFECFTPGDGLKPLSSLSLPMAAVGGSDQSLKTMDGVEVFDADMYVSRMHGGHGGSKTSSFKRCLFLKDIREPNVTEILVRAIRTRPSALCYLHLLHGGGAVDSVAIDATAFGCRGWQYACIVTGVWSRSDDRTETARDVVQWVYRVAADLLPLSCGVYSADLGPDPRDMILAAKAFGPNLRRLACLKQAADPANVLAYTCPLPKASAAQKLIILVTGKCGAGKDYCANVWVSAFTNATQRHLVARAVSISEATKRGYAVATGADLERLLSDRVYKEQHRSKLTEFFQDQVRQRPRLPEEHFLDVVHNAVGVDVLLITGMRDEAPVATLSHLVPASRVLEVYIRTSDEIRKVRRQGGGDNNDSHSTVLDHSPSLVFENDQTGDEKAKRFAENYLLPFFGDELQRLAEMVGRVSDFPCPGIEFHHILNIAQQPNGLALCASLLQSHFRGDWNNVDMIACCEAGGFVFAPVLASRVDVPLALIREEGKLPPPTVSVSRSASHISASATASKLSKRTRIEISSETIPRGASVVIVDDVLATGNTLLAILRLLEKVGVCTDRIRIIVVAEFPDHHGRGLLRKHGFGRVDIQSLLVFDGA